jgi:two-component sensor histidine kinase
VTPSSLNAVIHLTGFGAGIALYGLLAVMARPSSRPGGERLSFATAMLGLAWNAGAMVLFGLRDLAEAAAPSWLAFVSYAALGFLPAVAVHAAVTAQPTRLSGAHAMAAYAISVVAAVWQLVAVLQGATVPVRAAMLVLTIGNVALIGSLLLSPRSRSWGRQLSTVALAIFAVMALHLSTHADADESWWSALLGHHASLPLAFAILYQDYRFALADVFLKRALSLLAITAVAATMLATVVLPVLSTAASNGSDQTVAVVLVLSLWVATALLTPRLLRGIESFVDRTLLRRRKPQEVLDALAAEVRGAEDVSAVLDAGTRAIAAALSARESQWTASSPSAPQPDVVLEERGTRARVWVQAEAGPSYVISAERPVGGRRVLSEDRALLAAIAAQLGRRIETLRAADERVARDIREESLRRLTSEAELEALRAQLHPHFLFNALNTLGHLMQAAPDRARSTLYRLTALLRAVLQRSDVRQSTLGDELALVEDYLGIEQERFEERLTVNLDVPPALREARVPPLALQTLVENAIKHGISPLARGGTLSVSAHLDEGQLVLTVRDSGRGTPTATDEVPSRGGVGLSNLARRLERLYGSDASLHFTSGPETGTTVIIRVPANQAARASWRAAS